MPTGQRVIWADGKGDRSGGGWETITAIHRGSYVGMAHHKPPHAVAVEERFIGYEWDVAGQRLGDEHPVERVAVELRQSPGARGVVHGDGQFFKTLAGAIATQIKGDGCGLRQFCRGDVWWQSPTTDAALTNTSFVSSDMACLAGSDNRSLTANHQISAWVSSNNRNRIHPPTPLTPLPGAGRRNYLELPTFL